jgi:hypothetical protein
VKTTVNESAIAYSGVVGELGSMIEALESMLKPYDGEVRLNKVIHTTFDPFVTDGEGESILASIEVGIKVRYNPQKFHQALLDALRRAELPVKPEGQND